MSRPTARVLALLEILQAGGVHTLASLAERLGVDARTVRRYVAHLIDLDVPVESVRGRYGGYRLARGYRMPPLMLTDEEALATLLGLLTVRRAGLAPASAEAAEVAAAKLRRVLPQALGRRLDALLATARFTAPAGDATAGPGGRLLLDLAEAARARRPVELAYGARDGRRSRRVVHPYGLVAHSGRWYVTGADSAGEEVRTFRVDRIEHLRVLPGSFGRPDDFDAADHVLTGLAETPWAHEVVLRVQGALDHIRARFPRELAVVEAIPPEGGGEPWFRVRLRAERLEWIPPLIAALDRPFVIDEPAELRGLVAALARRLAAHAGEPPG